MFAIRGNARSRGPRDGSRTDWENRLARPHRWTLRHDTSTATPRGRRQPQPPARAVDRRLLARDRALPRPRARPRDRRAYFFGVSRADQRVHGRVPDPEPRARARRRRGALGRVRPRLQRAAREGGAEARLARRLDALLADAARPRRRSPRSSSCSRRCSCAPFGDPGGDYDLAVGLSRVLFPIVVLLGLSGIVVGILNTYDHFTRAGAHAGRLEPRDHRRPRPRRPANRTTRARSSTSTRASSSSGRWSSSSCRSRGCARLDGRLTVVIDWRDPAVKRVLVLMLPGDARRSGSSTSTSSSTRSSRRGCSTRSSRRPRSTRRSASTCSRRASSPSRSRRCSSRRSRGSPRVTTSPACGERSTAGCARSPSCSSRPASSSIVLAEPIVRLVYQRGEFTAEDTVIVAQCLQAFSLGLVFNGWMLILNRSFYACRRTGSRPAIALGAVALNAALDAVFYRLGIWGIPLATSIVNVVAATVLLVMMRRRVGARARRSHARGRRAHRRRRRARRGCVVRRLVRARRGARRGASRPARVARRRRSPRPVSSTSALARALGLRELEALLLLRARRDEPSDAR